MAVSFIEVDEQFQGQRLDNFLLNRLKGLPKTRLYRAMRTGEVRVNKGRIKPDYRVQAGDLIRIPPLQLVTPEEAQAPSQGLIKFLEQRIMHEDKGLIIINKPSGIPVHGGTGQNGGLIETLRLMRPQAKFLELVHRLDKETSGCLLIAKKRSVLLELHQLLTKKDHIHKHYLALVKGRWRGGERKVNLPLHKNQLKSGERVVKVDENGKISETIFKPVKLFANASLVEAIPVTGRTHQIRVHAAAIGHPIAGDEKYGDEAFNKMMRLQSNKRLFLHSAAIRFKLQELGLIAICAPLDLELQNCLTALESNK